MATNLWSLVVIMTVAGAFGGVINYFLERRDSPEKSSAIRSLVVGVGASFLVPLFLNMISSDLMAKMDQDTGKFLAFVGFCLIASIASSAFIRTLSDKVLKEASEAKRQASELREAMAPIMLREVEDNSVPALLPRGDSRPLDENADEVLTALGTDTPAWHSVEGIRKQTGLSPADIEEKLDELVAAGLVRHMEIASYGKRWAATAEGIRRGEMKMKSAD